MGSQWLNKYFKKVNKKKSNSVKRRPVYDGKPITDSLTGFIRHPSNFPIEVKRMRKIETQIDEQPESSDIGLIFDSEEHIKPGTYLEIAIQIKNKVETFRGKVVLIKNQHDYYEIGLWLIHREDASRARIIEQICHIETYLQQRKYTDGPYVLNRDRIAAEWIKENAASVPSL